jgi:signal transduction histidine kinase
VASSDGISAGRRLDVGMPRLSAFIRANRERILVEWETFARSMPIGGTMDVDALRDHAAQMLEVIAGDLEAPQSAVEQDSKARGLADADRRQSLTAAQEHGVDRADSGFSVTQMVSEFRVLRASVTRLWLAEERAMRPTDMEDLVRFNEAIDQAIAESITRYSGAIGQSKERFLAILGHDLRTPLGAIMTATRFMLETGELEEPHRTLVARAANSSRRMHQMVEDLLDFTRTRFGDSIPIVRTAMDLRRTVIDLAGELGTRYPECPIQVESSGDLRGEWDCDRLSQVLTNLIGNAVHHGAAGRPVRVEARGLPAEVRIAIHNEGPFIPPDRLARLFDGMERARRHASRDKHHLGLGLYIVERVVTAHGGSIEVTSTAEQGTTFTVCLPRSHAA